MIKRIILFLSLIVLCYSEAYSQKKDTVILMNGNVVVAQVLDTLLGAVTIPDYKKAGRNIHYEYEELYMVHYANGFKDYYYSQDTVKGNYFTRDEMMMFIRGEQDGRKGFKGNGCMITAGLLGFVGGATGTFFGPILPYGFMAVSGVPKIRIRHSTISNPNYIDSDAYILGYERSARYKRKIRALIGGTVGIAVGYAAYLVVFKAMFEGGSSIQFK